MMRFSFSRFFLVMGFLLSINMMGCRHVPIKQDADINTLAVGNLEKREISLVFVPGDSRVPGHLLYQRKDRITYKAFYQNNPFTLDMAVNPLMRNPTIVAQVMKNGSLQREFVATKSAATMLSDRRTSWVPTRSKLSLRIPFLTKNEEIVVTTSYEWMDIRWMPPIFLQDDGIAKESLLTVDVPYGITMHFKTAKDGVSSELMPTSVSHEKSLWAQQDNRAGLGMRYIWKVSEKEQSESHQPSDFLQVFLKFENPAQNDGTLKLDSWESVAKYLYDRIDRYDLPSNEIREFAIKETRELDNVDQKVARIFSFLKNDINKRPVGGTYLEQDVQPATRTFARRFGSWFDTAILGKAMLLSIGLNADIVAVSDKSLNPKVGDFHSPALFSSIILAVSGDNKTYYFDPEATKELNNQLRPTAQGQPALLLRPKKGAIFALPFDSAQKNVTTNSYQLWMTRDGVLEGDYSIDLIGLEGNAISEMSQEELKAITPEAMESKVTQTKGMPFPLETVETTRSQPNDAGLRIFGQIKPVMLAKNADGSFIIKLENIIQPAINTIKNASIKGYSSTTKISLFLSLFDDFTIKNLPANVNINIDGVSGRFSAYYGNGQLIVEGIAMVSLPVKTDTKEKLDLELKKLQWFVDQHLVISDSSVVTGATDGEHAPSNTENS